MDLQFLLTLQTIREASGTIGAGLSGLLTEGGSSTLVVVIVSIIYWCLHKQLGTNMALAMGTGSLFAQCLKNIFCVYRPWIRQPQIQPSQKALASAGGYSFPSMHSQTAASVYGTLLVFMKANKWRILLGVLILGIGFSRMFLGVHTPQDVFVGFLCGALSIGAAYVVSRLADKYKYADVLITVVVCLVTIIFLIFVTQKNYPYDYANGRLLVDPKDMLRNCYQVAGLSFGIFIGWLLERRLVGFSVDGSVKCRVIRALLGIILMLIIHKAGFIFELLFYRSGRDLLSSLVTVLFVLWIWPMIFTRYETKLFGKHKNPTDVPTNNLSDTINS